MITTQSTGDRRLTPSQREALGKFVPNPFPPAQASAPARPAPSEPLPIVLERVSVANSLLDR